MDAIFGRVAREVKQILRKYGRQQSAVFSRHSFSETGVGDRFHMAQVGF
jgi:hypothetical protein